MTTTFQAITRKKHIFTSLTSLAAFAGLLALSATSALAGFITPVSVTFAGSGNDPTVLINGSGLSGGAPCTGSTHQSNGSTLDDFGTSPAEIFAHPLTFNLGGIFARTYVDIWNYSHSGFAFYTERDSKNINISISTDGTNYSFVSAVMLTSTGIAPEPLQRFAISGDASSVRLQVTSTYSSNPFAHGIGAGLGAS